MRRVLYGPEIFRQRHGGISRYIAELHQRMPEHGIASRVYAGLHANHLLPRDGTVIGRRLPDAVTKGFDPLAVLNDSATAMWLRRHGSGALLHKSYYSGHAQLGWRGPVAVTVHDLIHALFPQHFPADDRTVELQRSACARADLVLAVSRNTADDLERVLGVPRERVVVTPLGVAPPDPAEAAGQARVRRPYLLYVGSRSGYKNWEGALRAYASASELHGELDLLCAGGGAFQEQETRLVEELGVAGCVLHLPVDDVQLGRLYTGATAYVYPSLYEGFGLPPLEAMVRGCPVVAAGTGSVPEVLGEAALLVDPQAQDQLREAMVQAVYDDALRARLRIAGHDRARTFTWDRTAGLTAQAYRALS